MAKYKNKKTKAIIETDCEISGGDWVEVKPRKAKDPASSETVTPGTENEDSENVTPGEGDETDNE